MNQQDQNLAAPAAILTGPAGPEGPLAGVPLLLAEWLSDPTLVLPIYHSIFLLEYSAADTEADRYLRLRRHALLAVRHGHAYVCVIFPACLTEVGPALAGEKTVAVGTLAGGAWLARSNADHALLVSRPDMTLWDQRQNHPGHLHSCSLYVRHGAGLRRLWTKPALAWVPGE